MQSGRATLTGWALCPWTRPFCLWASVCLPIQRGAVEQRAPAASWFPPCPPASHCVDGKLRLGAETGFPRDEGGRAGHSTVEPHRATQVGTCRKRLSCGQLSLLGEGPPSPVVICTPRSVHPCHVPRHACPPSHPMPIIHVQQLTLICCVSASSAPHPGPTLTPVHARKSWYSPHMPGTGHPVLHASLALL